MFEKLTYATLAHDLKILFPFQNLTITYFIEKKWLYADLLLKPEEKVLYGDRKHGGLSLVSVRLQAQACLIRNFLEMSINPSFIHSQFSQNLYRAFVLDECIKGLKPPPFYNKHFFKTIKKAIELGHSGENM